MGRAYIGPGGRLFPLRLNRDTAPRLWRAKHQHALAAMHRSNAEFEGLVSLGLAGVLSNVPVGVAMPIAAATTPGGMAAGARRARQTTTRQASTGDSRPAAIPASSGEPPVRSQPAHSKIIRRTDRAALIARTSKQTTQTWPPSPPSGSKPGLHEPNAATWRYRRYQYNAYQKGTAQADILPFATWRERHFEPALRGGRPGRPGSPAHQQDVKRNNRPNGIKEGRVGNRVPDGVGKPGRTLIIRGREIAPQGKGRVIVESDHFIRGGTIPDSAARAQMRDIRKAEPGATLVITDMDRPNAAPMVYPPGKQPPPPGPLPKDQAPVVPFPDKKPQ